MKKSMKCKSWMLLAMAAVSLGFQSCLDDDDDHYAYQVMVPNAIVTVKTTAEDDFFLQLDDTTTLLPVNITTSPFGKKEVRALTNFTPVDQPTGGYTQAVHVNKNYVCPHQKNAKNICRIKNVFYLCNPKRKERGCKGL